MNAEATYTMASQLLDAVGTAIEATDRPAPCRIGVVPGVIADDACCEDGDCAGQLAATTPRLFLADPGTFPQAVIILRSPCPDSLPSVELLVRYSLCVPTHSGDSPIPTPEALDTAGGTAMTVGQAMLCAGEVWAGEWRALGHLAIVRGVAFVGPRGDCLGVELTIAAEIADPPEVPEADPPPDDPPEDEDPPP